MKYRIIPLDYPTNSVLMEVNVRSVIRDVHLGCFFGKNVLLDRLYLIL
jgi:hypothetical protein